MCKGSKIYIEYREGVADYTNENDIQAVDLPFRYKVIHIKFAKYQQFKHNFL